jgi:hypothetical protein
MTFKELKLFCDKKIEEFPNLKEKYKKELIYAKRYFKNDINLIDLFKENKEKLKKQYVIPFLLGFTNEVIDEEFEFKFIKEGSSGGIDIDMDFDPEGKQKIFNYLKEKFGDERVISVGTFSRLGPSAAAKDLLRVYKVDYKDSNNFTKLLDSSLSWQDNIQKIKNDNPIEYKFYLKHKEILDLTPYFIGKIRQCLPLYQKVDITDKYGREDKKSIGCLNQTEDYIAYMDKDGNKKYTKNYNVFSSGRKKIYEITTKNGKKIRASSNHKFFLKSGEVKELKDLKIDDEIIISASSV